VEAVTGEGSARVVAAEPPVGAAASSVGGDGFVTVVAKRDKRARNAAWNAQMPALGGRAGQRRAKAAMKAQIGGQAKRRKPKKVKAKKGPKPVETVEARAQNGGFQEGPKPTLSGAGQRQCGDTQAVTGLTRKQAKKKARYQAFAARRQAAIQAKRARKAERKAARLNAPPAGVELVESAGSLIGVELVEPMEEDQVTGPVPASGADTEAQASQGSGVLPVPEVSVASAGRVAPVAETAAAFGSNRDYRLTAGFPPVDPNAPPTEARKRALRGQGGAVTPGEQSYVSALFREVISDSVKQESGNAESEEASDSDDVSIIAVTGGTAGTVEGTIEITPTQSRPIPVINLVTPPRVTRVVSSVDMTPLGISHEFLKLEIKTPRSEAASGNVSNSLTIASVAASVDWSSGDVGLFPVGPEAILEGDFAAVVKRVTSPSADSAGAQLTLADARLVADAHLHLGNSKLCKGEGRLTKSKSGVRTSKLDLYGNLRNLSFPGDADFDVLVSSHCLQHEIPQSRSECESMVGPPAESPIWLCLGRHPKLVAGMTKSEAMEQVEPLLESLSWPRVVGLGEVGLDYSSPGARKGKEQQLAFLRKLCSSYLKLPSELQKPFVLHVRGKHPGDVSASTACIKVLQEEGLPVDTKLYRHCFNGSVEEMRDWTRAFPNVVFGFGPGLLAPMPPDKRRVGTADFQSYTWTTLQAFARMATNQILVETDAPYLKPRIFTELGPDGKPREVNVEGGPAMARHVLRTLGSLKGIPVKALAELNADSVRAFYGLPPRPVAGT